MKKSVIAGLLLLTLFISASFVSAGILDILDKFFSSGSSGNEDPSLRGELGSLAPINTDNLIHYYKFDSSLTDSTGDANLRLASGRRVSYTEGVVDGAVKLDASKNLKSVGRLRIPNNVLSVSFFINFGSSRRSNLFIDKMSTIRSQNDRFSKGFGVRGDRNGIEWWAGGRGDGWLKCDIGDFVDRWNHIVLTAERNGKKKIYINGKFCAENMAGSRSLNDNSALFLGNRNLDGAIDEFKIWSRVLTDGEIKEIYDSYYKVTEKVECIFKNSKEEQKCYTAEENSRSSCSGTEGCIMDVNGKKEEKLTWKSSCGGYAYTTMDGNNEKIEFECKKEVCIGEVVPLFTGGTKLYVNDNLNAVRSILTSADLPNILKAGSFSGNVDVDTRFALDIGSNPKITFAKQPTSSDDPVYALTTSTTQANYIYNATVTFGKAVNFSHPDSEGQTIRLFNKDYVVAAETDTDTLVLLEYSKRLNLDSINNQKKEVTIEGSSYTIELVSASDTAATIKVTNSAGISESKEVFEAQSKIINGINIAVPDADETNLKLSATVVIVTNKITLEDGSRVMFGETDFVIDGTFVKINSNSLRGRVDQLTDIIISVYAPSSEKDAIKVGQSFIDPVYKTFRLDFTKLSNSDSREDIIISPKSDDKMDVTFTDWRGITKKLQWAKSLTGDRVELMADDDNRHIAVAEMGIIRYGELVVVGNENDGRLVKLSAVKNSSQTGSTNTNGDKVEFTDVFSGDVYQATWTSDGVGTISIGGKSYGVYMIGNPNNAIENLQVKLDYPDSSGEGVCNFYTCSRIRIAYPTIQTSKGAKIMFYKPLKWDLIGSYDQPSQLRIPDGDGYTDIDISKLGSEINAVSIGELNFELSKTANKLSLYLKSVNGVTIDQAALIVIEEKDNKGKYNAVITVLEPGRTGDDGLGVDSSLSRDTWSRASSFWRHARASDSKITDAADLWGTIVTFDASDADQVKSTISYPDEQIYPEIYMADTCK